MYILIGAIFDKCIENDINNRMACFLEKGTPKSAKVIVIQCLTINPAKVVNFYPEQPLTMVGTFFSIPGIFYFFPIFAVFGRLLIRREVKSVRRAGTLSPTKEVLAGNNESNSTG